MIKLYLLILAGALSCSSLALTSDLNGQWKVTKRVCANDQPARDDYGAASTNLVIHGDQVTMNALFISSGMKLPVQVHGRVYDRAMVFQSDEGYGAAVVDYDFDFDKGVLLLESKITSPEDRSCPFGMKLFTYYGR